MIIVTHYKGEDDTLMQLFDYEASIGVSGESGGVHYDYTAHLPNSTYASFDICESFTLKEEISLKEKARKGYHRFYAATNFQNFWIIDKFDKQQTILQLDFDGAHKLLCYPSASKDIKPLRDLLPQKWKDKLSVGKYGFYSLAENEVEFLCEQLGLTKQHKFYRYTTLESLVQMLQNTTYRINGIMSMNDKTEHCYTETGKACQDNDTFISSGSKKGDDLTMWRLYGDNARGVCLELQLQDEKQSGFFVQSVNYLNVDEVKKKVELIQNLEFAGLHFNYYKALKHFIKPINFSDEEEVRILFAKSLCQDEAIIKNMGWFINKENKILTPYIDFPIFSQDTPFVINKIVLGPNCPEKEINKEQLSALMYNVACKMDIECTIIPVAISEISNYR